jgi:hypothetical protein
MSDSNQDEFQAALATEFDLPPAEDTTPPAPTEEPEVTPPAEDKPTPEATPPAPVEKTEEELASEEAERVKNETPEETANRKATEDAAKANEEAPKPLTAEDIRRAIAEDRAETTGRVEQLHTAREEIITKLYPEGIDKNIYDTDGRVIKTAQDIVDRGLINDRTGEAYTYEEAASFILDANRQMAENIEELNSWAETVAEQNISLVESNQRVMSDWGDILKAMPKLAEELAAEYIQTQLQFDKTNSYITRMGMSPEAYYNRALAPYKQLGQALAEKQALEAAQVAAAQEEARQQQQDEQAERNGMPPQRGTSDVKANTGDPMLDALVDELNKG